MNNTLIKNIDIYQQCLNEEYISQYGNDNV